MVHLCGKCNKEFSRKTAYEKHLPCVQRLKFIDLFCGIGGFHLALNSVGAECVLACDIDKKCRDVYKENFGLEPHDDILELKSETIPPFDILCGGFPCQAFSHAGKQGGLEDTRGTLFREICRILKDCQPKYFLLENVKNLKGHDKGKTIQIIYKSLHEVGYTTHEPILLSPHHLGVPQHRERVFILGIRNDLLGGSSLVPFPKINPVKTDISSIICDESTLLDSLRISKSDESILNLWDEVIQHFKQIKVKLPTFPIWSDDWDSTYALTSLPEWKQKFINSNRELYITHKTFLSEWLNRARANPGFVGARRKFEWQCGVLQKNDSIWSSLFTFRPSGIRVKRTNYSPALVAMAQIVNVGSQKRKLSPREVARLQSFPDTFKIHSSPSVAYKQFGNSVNVAVIKHMAEFLIKDMVSSQTLCS